MDADVGICGTATAIDGLISTEAGDKESCNNCDDKTYRNVNNDLCSCHSFMTILSELLLTLLR